MFELNTAKVAFLNKEYERAAELFYEGATEGNAEAAFDYAYCLMNGYGVERDPALAKSFYVFASHRVGEAAYNLAVMYLRGIGVKRNYKKTFEYMKDAAELGVIEAQLYLGVAYTLGSLFEPDVVSISMIPYHTPEYSDTVAYIEGDVPDYEADEEARITAVRHDPHSAFSWFKSAAKHSPDYVEDFSPGMVFPHSQGLGAGSPVVNVIIPITSDNSLCRIQIFFHLLLTDVLQPYFHIEGT